MLVNSSSNSTVNFGTHFSYLELTIWYAFTIALSSISAILSVVLIVLLLVRKRIRRESGALIAYTLLMEAIVSSITCPVINLVSYRNRLGLAHSVNCALTSLFYLSAQIACNWAAVLLAISRVTAVVAPHKFEAWRSKTLIGLTILFSWLIGFGLTLPAYFGVGSRSGVTPSGDCGPTAVTSLAYIMMMSIMGWCTPVVFVAFLYGFLLVRQLVKRGATAPESNTRSNLRRLAVTKMLVVASGWYLICFIPSTLLVIFFPQIIRRYPVLLLISRICIICGYGANPIIYLAINNNYKVELKRLIMGILALEFTGIHSRGVSSFPPTAPHGELHAPVNIELPVIGNH